MPDRTQFNYAQRWRIEHLRERGTLKKQKRGVISLIFIGFLMVALLALPWAWQYKLKYDLKIVEQRIESYQEVRDIYQKMESLKGRVMSMNDFLRMAEANSKSPRVVLAQINSLLPPGTSVTSFSLQADNSVQLRLVLPGPVDVVKLWKNFRDSGLFEEFDLKTISLTDQVKNLNLSFRIK